MTHHLHKNDLPDDITQSMLKHEAIAVDTETLGLNPIRDKLCLVQLSVGDGDAHIVQLNRDNYDAPNLKKLLGDKNVTKIFHYARFDVAIIDAYLGVDCSPIYCTKIASKLVRTYTDRHGLKNVCSELAGVDLNKQQQSSDWGAEMLSHDQLTYAASDVLYLHKVKEKLDEMLEREGRTALAHSCFDFVITRATLDLQGWGEIDIFAHN